MRFGIVAVAFAAAAMALACGGGDDDESDPTSTPGSGSTATQPADATTAAPGETTTQEPSETGTPVVLEPAFECESPIGVLEARAMEGEEVEFSERVYATTERDGNGVLAVGAPFDAVLRVEVVIREADIDAPLTAFEDRVICARGTVDNVGGVRTIYIDDADQLTVVAE